MKKWIACYHLGAQILNFASGPKKLHCSVLSVILAVCWRAIASTVIKQADSNWKFQFLNVMEDQCPSANNSRDIVIPLTEAEGEDHHHYFDGRRIHRVPQHMRFKKHHYTPKMVSFGPYYHGLSELGIAEEFKDKALAMFCSSSGNDKQFCCSQILKVIDQIRNCYVGVSRDEYDDGALANMMLLDASFSIYLMEMVLGDTEKTSYFHQHLGQAAKTPAFQDMYLLENQIPLWVITLLINLILGKESTLLRNFLSFRAFGDRRLRVVFEENEMQPLHLLDAFHQLHVKDYDNTGEILVQPVNNCQRWPWRKENPSEYEVYNRLSRSVTDLKAKGIHFKPGTSCLKNIKFKSSTFYGQLEIPVWFFSPLSELLFTHMIAYEVSPGSNIGIPMICYVNFLKSLIIKSEDVKELREKKIFFSSLDSDEQVVEVIKGIDTWGLDYDDIFSDVKMKIEKHCSSKAKTWIAELIHTYYPWTFIALLAATFLLCLTFLQTHYTTNPNPK